MTDTIVGFVGLGNMGAPMVRNLAAAGFAVTGFDICADNRVALDGLDKVRTTDRLAEAAGADVLVLMLPNGHIVREVLLGADGALAHLPAGGLVVDMSSSDPEIYPEIAAALAEKDIGFIDAPVSGNVRGAAAGTLTIMAGGDDVAIDRATSLFSAMGEKVFRTGALGTGQVMKALNNLVSAGALMMTVEALLVARKAGLDPAQANAILNVSTGRNNSTERKIEPFVLSGAYNSGFGLSLMAKDLRTAGSVAGRLGADMPLANHAIEMASAAEAALGPDADHTEVARWLENVTGLRLR